jgi:hypothetical protein
MNMQPKGGVFAAVKKPVVKAEPEVTPDPASAVQINKPTEQPENNKAAKPSRHTTRIGKVFTGFYLPKDTHKRLKRLALEEDTDMQVLLCEALVMLFENRTKVEIDKTIKQANEQTSQPA